MKLSMQDELKYRMTSDDRCREYFYIDVDSGDISLKKLLEDETITRFEVFEPYCLALQLYALCTLFHCLASDGTKFYIKISD